MNRLLARPGWVIFLVIVLLGTVINAHLYFAAPLHEESDFAVNALQIDQAKHLREIHGNYSRFNFDHPGPAFFYVYALGERVLRDLWPVAGSPSGAHLFAGLLLQAGFFALALSLLGRWIQAPLFLPLALLGGAIHFWLATHIFLSVWPPHVLVMPFLAFWVAAVSVAAGRGQDLPWLVLAGSFLAHGHASEPLFVLVLSGAAYGCLAWGLRRGPAPPSRPWATFPRAHLIASTLLAVFLLPLVLDLLHGRSSNFAAILRHLRYNEAERKSLSDSLLYFLSFFSYLHDQEGRFDPATAAHSSFLREHIVLYAAWFVAGAWILNGLFGRRPRVSPPVRRFGRFLLGFWLLTAVLCLEWGILQTGPMFEFNGYFYYSVIYCLGLLLCALLAETWKGQHPRIVGTILCGAALPFAWAGLHPATDWDPASGLALRAATLKLLRADPHPTAPKLLVFAHDDWGPVASAALALERAGQTVYVPPAWSFMFQRAHVLPRSLLVDPQADLSVWRFIHAPLSAPGGRLNAEIQVIFQPATLSPDQGIIDFSGSGHLEWYALCGIVTPDSAATWTDSAEVAVQFRPLPTTHDVVLRLSAAPFLCGKKLPDQPVEVRFNGILVGQADLTAAGEIRAVVPRALWNSRPVALYHLSLPHARTPAELGLSGDPRQLGLALRRLTAGR